jgi:iron-sulfur cluster repair protein YtfE (RIC family)
MVERSWTVNETIERVPATLPVLNSLGIDTCCGGGETLDVAASRSGVDENVLLAALATVRGPGGSGEAPAPVENAAGRSGGCACGCRKAASS